MKRYEDFSPSAIRQVRALFLTPTSPKRSLWRGWNSYLHDLDDLPADRELDWDDIRTVLVILWPILPSERMAFNDLLAWPGYGREWTEIERGIAAHSLACYIDDFNEDMWWELDLMLEAIDRLGGAEILEAVGDQAEFYLETKERRRLEKLNLGES